MKEAVAGLRPSLCQALSIASDGVLNWWSCPIPRDRRIAAIIAKLPELLRG
jgi:hypothetical protein